MVRVSMLNANITDLNKCVNKFAINNKSFAERLVFHNNVNNHITKKTLLYDLGFDIFDKEGKLTDEGKEAVLNIINENKLSGDASWYDALKASHIFWYHSTSPLKNKYTLFDYMENRL